VKDLVGWIHAQCVWKVVHQHGGCIHFKNAVAAQHPAMAWRLMLVCDSLRGQQTNLAFRDRRQVRKRNAFSSGLTNPTG
jgi:hypothetical protein